MHFPISSVDLHVRKGRAIGRPHGENEAGSTRSHMSYVRHRYHQQYLSGSKNPDGVLPRPRDRRVLSGGCGTRGWLRPSEPSVCCSGPWSRFMTVTGWSIRCSVSSPGLKPCGRYRKVTFRARPLREDALARSFPFREPWRGVCLRLEARHRIGRRAVRARGLQS